MINKITEMLIRNGNISFVERNCIKTTNDVENILYEICDDTHAHCNDNCPVYKYVKDGFPKDIECKYHKSGREMRLLLEEKN